MLLPAAGLARKTKVAPSTFVRRSTTTKGSLIDPPPLTRSRTKPPSSSENDTPRTEMEPLRAGLGRKTTAIANGRARQPRPARFLDLPVARPPSGATGQIHRRT